jgi:hypothetical protein
MNQENANEIKTLRFSSLNRKCNKFNGLRIFMHQSPIYIRFGHVSDVPFTILHAMLMPSSEGERHDTHCSALPPLSPRSSHEGWQDQSANLKHDPENPRFSCTCLAEGFVNLLTILPEP